jgi:hypothetical protein
LPPAAFNKGFKNGSKSISPSLNSKGSPLILMSFSDFF